MHTIAPSRTTLIFGINYWPEETGNAPYTTGLAEHLARLGDEVHVVAGMPYYPSWRVHADYAGKLRMTERRNGVTIHRFRQYIPESQNAITRIGFETSFLVNAMIARGIPRPDRILGYLPSLSDGVLAMLAAKRYVAPYGLLVQDLVGQAAAQSGIPGGARIAGATRSIEGWAARQAAAVGVVAEGFRPRLIDLGVAPDRIHRVRNWTHVGGATRSPKETREKIGLPRHAKIALHAGNMGLKQGLENVIDAARLAEKIDPELLFVLVGDGNQRDMLVERAQGLSNVRFLPSQAEEEFPNVLAAADVLLINQRLSVTDMSLPSKLTSYLRAGKPVVAAVAPASETVTELNAARAGEIAPAGDPAALVSAIRHVLADPDRAAQLGANGTAYATGPLSPDAALGGITRLLDHIMSDRPSTQTEMEHA